MTTVLLAILILGLVITAMSVGVLCGRKPIKGSCGGMSSLGIDTACDICGGDTSKCEEEQSKQNSNSSHKSALAYDASESLKGGNVKADLEKK